MEIERVNCECCGLEEECTELYKNQVMASFDGKWLCGLCCEAVRDEVNRSQFQFGVREAVRAHMSFCGQFNSNPAGGVAKGMRQILRRRSGELGKSGGGKFGRSASAKVFG